MHAQLSRPFQTQLRDTVMKIHLTDTQLSRFFGSLWDFPEIEDSPLVVQQIYGKDDIISIPLDKNLWSHNMKKVPVAAKLSFPSPASSESNRTPDRFRLFSISRYAGPTLMWLDDFFPSRSLTFRFYELSTTRAAAAESEGNLSVRHVRLQSIIFGSTTKSVSESETWWWICVPLFDVFPPEKREVCDENLIKRLLLVCARG